MRVTTSRQAIQILQKVAATPRGARGFWNKLPDFETLRKMALDAVKANADFSAKAATTPRREIESLELGFRRRQPEPPPTPKPPPPEEIPLAKLNKDYVDRKFPHLSDDQRAALLARMFSEGQVQSSWDAEDSDYEGTKATIDMVTQGPPIAVRPRKVEETGPPCVSPEPEPAPPPGNWDEDMGRIVKRLFPWLPEEDLKYVLEQLFNPDRGEIKQAVIDRLPPDLPAEEWDYIQATLLSSEPGYTDKIGTEPVPMPKTPIEHREWDPEADSDVENIRTMVHYAKTEPGQPPLIRPQPFPKSDPPSET